MPRFVDLRLNLRPRPEIIAKIASVIRESLPESVEVLGGGIRHSVEGEPVGAYVHLRVEDDDTTSIDAAVAIAERWAGIGSYASVDGGAARSFGVAQGLALYLNGTDLPMKVYRNSNTDELVDRLVGAIGRSGFRAGHWQGPRDSAVYFFGRSYETMRDAILPIVESDPALSLSRIQRIA